MSDDEFSPAFSAAFDPPAAMPYCLTPDMSCCPTFDDYDADVQQRALTLAGSSLITLSGYRLAGCPVTVRPCRDGCLEDMDLSYWAFPLTPGQGSGQPWMSPQPSGNGSGSWVNNACGCTGDCSCTTVCSATLPGPVGGVVEVWEDGVLIDPTAYRVDNGSELVRTDGECWPLCQDMTVDHHAEGAFSVTYYQGMVLDAAGQIAYGTLVCEYLKACSGQACRLPGNVTQLTRQGVTMQLSDRDMMRTGIPEVDSYIRRINPNRLVAPPTVWFPGQRRPRRTTWQAT